MLEGLDRIDWGRLKDAYGPAHLVPGFLRQLSSDDADEREDAVFKLSMGLCHQQVSVAEATAAAIPFLLELAGNDDVADRPSIVKLLAEMAVAGSQNAAMSGEGLEDLPPSEVELLRSWGRDAARAVWKGFDLLLSMLHQEDPELRISAAYALSRLHHHAQGWTPEGTKPEDFDLRIFDSLASRLGAATELREKLAMVLSLGDLAGSMSGPRERLRALAESASPRELRVAAALRVIEEGGEATPAMGLLIREALTDADVLHRSFKGLPWIEGWIRFRLTACLAKLPETEFSEEIALRILSRVSSMTSDAEAKPLLSRFFPSGGRDLSPEKMTDPQRRALTTLLENKSYWEDCANGEFVLASLKLPPDRPSLAQFLGRPDPRLLTCPHCGSLWGWQAVKTESGATARPSGYRIPARFHAEINSCSHCGRKVLHRRSGKDEDSLEKSDPRPWWRFWR